MSATERGTSLRRHVALEDEGQQTPSRKNRVSSLLKRFVGNRALTKTGNGDKPSRSSRWRKTYHKRDRSDRSLSELHPPEILKVSPMSTSCEVTLVSESDEDRPFSTHQITVTTQNGTREDNSYHVVLNPHRNSVSKLFLDDAIKEDADYGFSSEGSTHALTNDLTSSAQSSSATCVDTTSQNNNNQSCEETIYFVRSDEQFLRERHDVMIRKESLFYKSLFDTSDESEDEDDEFWGNHESWREGSSPRITDDPWYYDERASAHAQLKKQQEALNTTLDTALLETEYDDDEYTFGSREDGFPIEITVQI